ncbi:hypothetical protein LINPERHAP1_LOCUS38709 [Linum perenne]
MMKMMIAHSSVTAAASVNGATNNNINNSAAAAAQTPTVIQPFQVALAQPSTRRCISIGLLGGLMGLHLEGPNIAEAAARRPPPAPSTEEKKDPNISGVQAKVLASKKRKEAMKQYVAKLKEQVNTPN